MTDAGIIDRSSLHLLRSDSRRLSGKSECMPGLFVCGLRAKLQAFDSNSLSVMISDTLVSTQSYITSLEPSSECS